MGRRELKKYLKNNLLSLFVLIALMISGIAMASNIIVNEGSLEVGDSINVSNSLFVNSANNKVGIGTSSPSSKLDVVGADMSLTHTFARMLLIDSDSTNTATVGGVLLFQNSSENNAGRIGIPGSDGALLIESGDINGNMTFRTGGTNKAQNRMFISASGSVGIGTITPSYPLQVKGNVSGISIFSDGNVSASGFITRTSVFDKSLNPWDYVKDADYFKNPDGTIAHEKFYGYTEWQSPDYDNPIISGKDAEGNDIITYPTIIIEGVNLESEINVLRQAVFQMKTTLCSDGHEEYC